MSPFLALFWPFIIAPPPTAEPIESDCMCFRDTAPSIFVRLWVSKRWVLKRCPPTFYQKGWFSLSRSTFFAPPFSLHLSRSTFLAPPFSLHLSRSTFLAPPFSLHLSR